MTTKLQQVSNLMEQTTKRIMENPQEWANFLQTAARLYKYSFEEQILIYAQRPNATACAPIDFWNKRMRRWVNRGTKGIALMDNSYTTLRYVFDVSDTYSLEHTPLRLWQMEEAYQEQVIEELADQFGDADETPTVFDSQLKDIISNVVQDNMSDYISELLTRKDGSYLADLDDLNTEAIFRKALANSVSYMVFSRLGLDTKASPEDLFKDTLNFNTFDTLMQLGGAASDISEMVLRQIERTVISIKRHENAKLDEALPLKDNNIKDNERRNEHGDHIHKTGGLSDTRLDIRRAGDTAHRQIRNDEKNVSPKPQERDIRGTGAVGEAEQPLGGYRGDGQRTGGSDNEKDGYSAGRDGGTESQRSDEMGGHDEHDQAPSGGSGTSGPDLQLNLFPTEEQQIEAINQAEAEKTSAFSFLQEDIDSELLRGSGFEHGKCRIYRFYQAHPDTASAAAFLKHEYGIGGRSRAYLDGTRGFVDHNTKGLTFKRWDDDRITVLSWNMVHHRLNELIFLDRYLSEKEKAYLPAFEQEEVERAARFAEEQLTREALRLAAEKMTDTRHVAKYGYALGDTVYIGVSEYTVIGYDEETVTLNDEKFPLLSKEMPRLEFNRRLRENPLNDGLIVKDIAPNTAEPADIKYEMGFGMKGNGTTVWNRLREVDGDYETIAHISDEGEIKYYRDDLPTDVMQQIEEDAHRQMPPQAAEPATQADNEQPIKLKSIVLDFTQPRIEKHDFRITDDDLGHGGAKTKYGFNVAAIRTLQTIEAESRIATAEEQDVLSRYVGWGGIPQAFDAENASWVNEYAELKQLLSEDEYNSARESTLNAHYTSPTVIKAMYQAIENMGFKTGNVLEPACGIGNFFGLVPESMKNSKLYGVELDSITGRIAKQLYQTANISVQGYEQTSLPDSFFDLAIGNVPFGDYGIADKRYDKNHFLIHDYFFAKTLDKVRPGGIIAFITSSGTMDKKNSAVRKYIAQRADLLGAVRLPNNAFLKNAGTQVVADILFLQKRDRPIEIDPDWVHLGKSAEGFTINQYYIDNPDMVLGNLTEESTQYGRQECTVAPIADADLSEQLRDAMANIHAEITEFEHKDELEESTVESIPADPDVRNFSYALVDGQVYFREDSRMNKIEASVTAVNRIRGMIELRDCTRKLIEYQLESYPDEAIQREQQHLNTLYDNFTAKYGLINSRANNMAFSEDSSYSLLCSLEVMDENGELERKADMFTKRTIKPHVVVTSVETASEALAVSLAEKACVDLPYMASLTGLSGEQIETELQGVIFRDFNNVEPDNVPRAVFQTERFPLVTADEYLSGNVRQKLKQVRELVKILPADQVEKIQSNVTALEAVQPQDLTAGEIDVRLGATWLPKDDIQQFVIEFLKPSFYAERRIKVHYSPYTASWNVEGKNLDYDGVLANVTYGTNRINAYQIIEQTLNLKDVRIFDRKVDPEGREIRVLNRKETTIAQQKQQQIKDAFCEWLWKDQTRRERLVQIYNEKFNSIRPREYDGSHLKFSGINPEITLRPHQVNAIARILHGGNTLLGHVVGAGKTYEMVAAAMESKRLGLCNKSLFAVPNHLTEQWAAEFLQLYPSANILVATRKDFEKRNRRRFCGRIATGDYDAVIIGHSQFEKIPMSVERQKVILQEQLDEIVFGIEEAKNANAERFTVKQLEKTKKAIKLKLDKLNDTSRKDDVVTFEELGVDRLFVDEAHSFKNLFLVTKMRNVAGLAQTEAQKSSDLFTKCRYLDELTGGRGVMFATGTPISNSMTELYTMQRYLQYKALRRQGLHHFDAWASTFGETVTAIELAPEGTGYRAKTRFARFYNLPELISMFKMVADIQTSDMLNLPVPEAEYHNVVIKPSEYQRDMVAELAERAEKVRNGMVDATEDNMLKITNDGRKAKTRTAQSNQQTEQIGAQIAALEVELQEHNAELERVKDALIKEQARRTELEGEMEQNERVKTLLGNLDALTSSVEEKNARRDKLISQIIVVTREAWRGLVGEKVGDVLDGLQIRMKELDDKAKAGQVAKSFIDDMRKAVGEKHCHLCDQDIDGALIAKIEERVKTAESSYGGLTEDEAKELTALQGRRAVLEPMRVPSSKERLEIFEGQLATVKVEISDTERKLKEVMDELERHGEIEDLSKSMQENVKELSQCIKRIEALEESKKAENDQITRVKAALATQNARLDQTATSDDMKLARRKVELCEQIHAIFDEGVGMYRDKRKSDVENDATDLFLMIRNDPDYVALKINDNYGLNIVHSSGEIVPLRSSGYEHVVALSLIGALHKNAPMHGPVIMDSPFGRLDPTHKENITAALPYLSEQVFLLAYTREIDEQQARDSLGPALKKEYRLTRYSAFHTTIDAI